MLRACRLLALAAASQPRATPLLRQPLPTTLTRAPSRPLSSSVPADHMPAEEYLASFTNYEQQGIPAGAGVEASGKFDLTRMRHLLHVLGDPQAGLRAVHIAGSKGKGSTAVLLTAILREAGLRVGLYTSPHLHHISERISTLQGAPLAPQQLEALVHRARPAVDPLRADPATCPTHFELLTALALRHFAEEGVDLAVVETGMGGLTDATNVFEPSNLAAAVITPIGLEHVEALGGSLASIAAAKAGILKAGRPLVLAPQTHSEAEAVLLEAAAQQGCPVVRAEERVQVAAGTVELNASSPHQLVHLTLRPPTPAFTPSSTPQLPTPEHLPPIPVNLIGPHQHINIATAVTAALTLRDSGLPIPAAAIAAGLAAAQLPGRFQVVRVRQPPSLDPTGTAAAAPGSAGAGGHPRGAQHVVLDGAHSPESAAALAETLRAVFPGRPLALVLAMANDKDHRAVVAALRAAAPAVVVFTTVPIAGSYTRSAPPGTLAAQWQAAAFLDRGRPLRCRQLIQASLGAAFEKACHELRGVAGEGVVCVTGSLHAVAAASKLLHV